MSDMTCPQCEAEVGDKGFCPQCGASLESRECPSCGESAPPGSRFCTNCGSSLTAPPAGAGNGSSGDGRLGWWVAGLVMTALILFLVVPVLLPNRGLQEEGATSGSSAAGSGAGQAGGGLGPAPNVDISSMTPRQAADRLFNRVMQAGEAGDTTQVMQFLPMAMGAYERARPLDADGLFHLAVLQHTGEQFEAALRTASTGLEEHPNHLLLLSAAADAARELGDSATARTHYSHILEVWDEERDSGLEEYRLHSALLPQIRNDAQDFLEGS